MTDPIPASVAQYLDRLKKAFAGAPQGLIADALADCDEHMQGAIAANPGRSEAEVLDEVIASYGSPEEVAAAYRQSEDIPAGPFARPAAPVMGPQALRPGGLFGPVRDPATYGALLYMLLSLITGVFYFSWVVTGLSLSFGLFVLIIGIPFFLLFVGSVRLLAHVEGRIVESLLGVRMPRRLPSPSTAGFWTRVKDSLTDLRTWSSIAYMLLMLPLGIFYFVVAAVGLAIPFGLLVGGIWHLFTTSGIQVDGGPAWVVQAVHLRVLGLVLAMVGAVLFLGVMHLARLIGRFQGKIAENLLVRL